MWLLLILLGLALLILIGVAGFSVGYTLGLSRLLWRRMSFEERAVAVVILTVVWVTAILLVARMTGGL